ncbi:hypothetical protein IW148_003620 [Coemansia sp. RSA 1199]|nr:hypothetical protein IW148_003620 [Coemansia sp. RSA 1199]
MSTREIHVVVVGVSTAGISVAKKIAALAKDGFPNLRVTIIDKNEYTYHSIGAPRGIVDKQFGRSLFFRLDTLLAPFEVSAKPKHRFIQALLTNVNSKTIELNTGETLAFDYLVLATGAANSFPGNVNAPTLEDGRLRMAQLHENVEAANNVLVIGGGAVGVEIAGEIADQYPSKQVTLVHSASRLLPLNFKEGISNGAVYKLRRLGVRVVLNERINIPADIQFDGAVRPMTLVGRSGREYTSDVQFLATGTKVYSEYMASLEKHLGTVLREKNGTIKVKPTLQLASDALPNIFVVGDVNSLPAGAKYAVKAGEQAQLAAANLIAMISAGFDNAKATNLVLQNWNGSVMNMIAVPIGKSLGVLQASGIAFGKSCVGDIVVSRVKAKDYFVSKTAKEFPPNANA